MLRASALQSHTDKHARAVAPVNVARLARPWGKEGSGRPAGRMDDEWTGSRRSAREPKLCGLANPRTVLKCEKSCKRASVRPRGVCTPDAPRRSKRLSPTQSQPAVPSPSHRPTPRAPTSKTGCSIHRKFFSGCLKGHAIAICRIYLDPLLRLVHLPQFAAPPCVRQEGQRASGRGEPPYSVLRIYREAVKACRFSTSPVVV